jgi:hypothetical protein
MSVVKRALLLVNRQAGSRILSGGLSIPRWDGGMGEAEDADAGPRL